MGFGGGEPTLHPHLVDICRHAAWDTGLAVSITSNGLHLSETLVASLAECVHFMRISMDGVSETYEAIRGRSFEDLLAHLGWLRGMIPFGINCVVNERTLPELDVVAELAHNLGAAELLLLPEQATRGSKGIDEATADGFGEWVRSYPGYLRIAVSEAGSRGLPCCRPLAAEAGLREYAHVSADGVLKTSSIAAHGDAIGYHGVLASMIRLKSLEGVGTCESVE